MADPRESDCVSWAREHESGPGEENERTLDLSEFAGGADCVQTWAEWDHDERRSYVGFWASTHGTEARWDLTPEQARELAANLLVSAYDADHGAEEWMEDDWTEGPCQPMQSGCTGAPHRPGCPERDCTGLTATWCPVHGDCTCTRHEDSVEVDFDEMGTCPLHAHGSDHAEGDNDRSTDA